MSAFGDEIRRLLEAKGWTIESMVDVTGFPSWVIEGVERGAWWPLHFDLVVGLSLALSPLSGQTHCDLAHLLRLSGCALPPGLALVEEDSLLAAATRFQFRNIVAEQSPNGSFWTVYDQRYAIHHGDKYVNQGKAIAAAKREAGLEPQP